MLDNTTTSSAANQDAKSGLVRVMGLWENTDRKGNKYFSGNLTNSVRVMIFKNSYKTEGSRDPEFILYVSQRSQEERQGGSQQGGGQGGGQQGGGQQGGGAESQSQQRPNQPVPEDDIPF